MDAHAYFHWLDYVVFLIIILISISIGIFHGIRRRENKSSLSFFLGNREMQWVPVGLSILVTFQSSILYLGIPAEIYMNGTSYFLFHIGMAFAVLICCTLFVPLLFPLKLTSVYEYLERRYHSRASRIVGSMIGMMNMLLYAGVVIFAPATAMEAASGFPVWASIILIGFVATCYTALVSIEV
ncbi:hypothetical protein CAPTEDRAFT_175398 [Capitella teleta]|uniref:Sodium-dependent multivitamin transporter n=1 Tax=Capitella teleta TaxID=283909 RepID=R7UVC4_CAPTE|nr:hypothetical protein CAPTEDRAFT_175398 [Capitella teleta]|eukprot:ELU10234.1 hypothetical protein CAPTEDRAFT_175398 [Capitella teleta]